ncbi:MAG: response regulator transcription factor [Adlercreutzia equolifaciens]
MGKAITKDSVFDSMRRVEAALKLRYMGIGFVWAWLYCTYATSAVFPYRSGQSINSDESWLLSAVAVVLGFLVGGLLLSRRPLGGHCLRRFSIAAALLLAAGTIVSALGALLGLAWLGGAMTGVGYALLSLLWARALMVLDVEELEAVVPLSSLVIVPCVVVYPLLEGVVGVVATALLPLMSGVLLLLCLREGAKRGGVEEAASSVGGMSPYLKDSEASGDASASSGAGASLSRRFGIAESWGFYLGRVAVVLVVLYLAIGWQAALADVRDSMHALIDLDVSMLISSLASVALGIAIVFFSRRVSFTGLFRWAVPCVIITLVLHGSSGLWAGFVSNAIGDTLDSLIQVLVYLFAITLAKQGKAPVALGVGLLNGSVQLGVLFGNLAGSACAGPAAASSEVAFLSALICLVALVGIVAPQREPIEVRPMAEAGSDALEHSLMVGCELLQKKFGLSDRETEIAFLLARGYSRPYIREKLFISKNTVATHIRHIYGKLGIHSKEELIDLATEAARK